MLKVGCLDELTAVAASPHQASMLELAQVKRERGSGHIELGCDLTNGASFGPRLHEEAVDRKARLVGKPSQSCYCGVRFHISRIVEISYESTPQAGLLASTAFPPARGLYWSACGSAERRFSRDGAWRHRPMSVYFTQGRGRGPFLFGLALLHRHAPHTPDSSVSAAEPTTHRLRRPRHQSKRLSHWIERRPSAKNTRQLWRAT